MSIWLQRGCNLSPTVQGQGASAGPPPSAGSPRFSQNDCFLKSLKLLQRGLIIFKIFLIFFKIFKKIQTPLSHFKRFLKKTSIWLQRGRKWTSKCEIHQCFWHLGVHLVRIPYQMDVQVSKTLVFFTLEHPFGKDSLPNGRPSVKNTGVFHTWPSIR